MIKFLHLILSFAVLVLLLTLTTAQTLPDTKEMPERLDRYLRPYFAVKDFSGVVLIAQGDTILAQRAYGLADVENGVPNRLDTAFRIASLSKAFTGAAISILIERQQLRLDDPLSRFFPGFPNGSNITVNQLLLHRSGVGQLDQPELMTTCYPTSEMVRRIGQVKTLFPPGTDSSYSNEGYVLLAAIIEKVSQLTYAEFLKKNIFVPLGMRHSGTMCTEWPVARHAVGYLSGLWDRAARMPGNEAGWNGPGSVYSTVGDLYLWLKAIAANKLFQFDKLAYPYGWGVRKYSKADLVEQTGELRGFNAHMALYPKDKIYFVYLSNSESGLTNRLPHDLDALLFGGKLSSPPLAPEVTSPEVKLENYVGTYSNSTIPVPIGLSLRGGHIWMRWGKEPYWRPLTRTGPDKFYFRSEYAQVTFQRGAKGEIITVAFQWNNDAPLVFTKSDAG